MGIKLRQAGFHDFAIYEKAARVGGTWRENTYPGLTCDVPSSYYTFSFAPNPSWSSSFPPGQEIWDYFERTADDYDLRPHLRLGEEITSARFERGQWHIRTAQGRLDTADFLVTATGFLHHPHVPDIPGLDGFAGSTFHSARWDHSVEVAGKRVATVGTGSSGIQLVSGLAGSVGRLLVFQRTAQWAVPMPNHPFTAIGRLLHRSERFNRLAYRIYQFGYEKVLAKQVLAPGWQRSVVAWSCRMNLRRVKDPELRRRLTPVYRPACKRLAMSSTFYQNIQRPNVELVTEAIDHVEERGIVTKDGVLHEVDVLVLATGFDPHAFMRPMEVVGENGATIAAAWDPDPYAYRTVAMPGFPNLFMLVGPYSPVGSQSVITISETQADYVVRWLEKFAAGEVDTMAPTQEATDAFNEDVRRAMPGTIWATGCTSWYLNSEGLPELWPWAPERHREMLAEPELAHFETRAPERVA
jgi:cation diffusion facilitator CzcD-associated flavoprotein CzcO